MGLWFLAFSSARGIAGNQSQEAFKNGRSAGGFGSRTYSGPRLPPNRSRHVDRRDGGSRRTRGRPFFVRRTAFHADLRGRARLRAAPGTVADSPAPPPRTHPHRSHRPGEAVYEEDALDAFEMLSHYVALAIQNHTLGQTLAQRVSENLRLLASLHGFYDNALEAFATAIDVKHINIHGHSLRVGRYSQAIGEALGMDPTAVASLRSAAYLHDIGMVAVDKRLLGKAAQLDPEESREMRDHTVVGHQIVSQVQFPWPQIPEIVRWHHERADGSGYPDGLHGNEIPQPVRIVALAESFDAMTSERPYRERLSLGSALQELIRMAPEKYDAQALQALLIQVRRDAVGSNRLPILEAGSVNVSPVDIDALASTLQHRISQNRTFLT